MRVTCPECNFSNEIPEDKIPANAQLATCPKCGVKFQFRELLPKEDLQEQEPDSQFSYEQDVHQQYDPPSLRNEEQLETEQPGTDYEPLAEAADELHANDPDIPVAPEAARERVEAPEDEKSDIWQSLDSMRPEGLEEQEEPAVEGNRNPEQEVPFEHLEKYGFFPGFFLTIKKVLLTPASFFKDMELSGFIKPLIFFILLAEFQEICNFIWATTGIDSSLTSDVGRLVNDSIIVESLKEGSASALFSLLLYPLMLAGISFPLIGVTHILLMVFGAGDRGYQATFRATAYSYAPIILCVLPIVGDMVGALVSMAISIIAYKNIHNTTYMRVVLSMMMPVLLLLVILGFYMNFNQPTI